jgi:hypothetical protein
MNHTNSGTCNTGEEETEGKEREKQASKQKRELAIARKKPIGQQSADRCVLAWALQNLGFCEFAFLEKCKTHRHKACLH